MTPLENTRRSAWPALSWAALVVFAWASMGGALAVDSEPEPAKGVHPPVDRQLSRGIERAAERVAAGEFSQAIRFLDEVLARQDDFFISSGKDQGYAGIKATARKMLRELPEEGRTAYESAYEPAAKRMLTAAVAAGGVEQLLAVVQRYFATPSGREAALILAREEADAGRRLEAATWYEQLLDDGQATARFDPYLSVEAALNWLAQGDAARSTKILQDARERGVKAVNVAGQRAALPKTGDLAAWLRQTTGRSAVEANRADREWIAYRGSTERNGETRGGLPHLRVRWRAAHLLGNSKLDATFADFAANLAAAGKSTPVAAVPLAVGDTILVRTPQELLAVDFRTGKRIWRSEPEQSQQLEQLIASPASRREELADPDPAQTFARRIWDDYLYNTISSDGVRAFAIRDLALPRAITAEAWGAFGGGYDREPTNPANRLCAYELATQGKRAWEIDGAATKGELAGAFFGGAPPAVGPTLYALVEAKNRLHLLAIDAATGAILWRQQLVDVEVRVAANLPRRMQAAMPSYGAGMIVCPTGAGIIVAVDPAQRSLAWAYQYATPLVTEGEIPGRGGYHVAEGETPSHWLDAAVVIAGDRVLLTPPEGDELHCLDLRSGKLLWKQPREELTRLACVDSDIVLLYGSEGLQALRLADGKNAWDALEKGRLEFDGGAQPTGTGFLSDGKYYLPLSGGEVVAVDVQHGKFAGRVAAREGEALGNLICHRGAVISHTGSYLDRFDQIETLRRQAEKTLATDPHDAESLQTMGEIAFNEDRLSEAVDLLEQSHHSAPDDLSIRETLVECLATALDEDFVAFRARLPLLEQLQVDDQTALTVLRLKSKGLLEAGDLLAAARPCVELFRSETRSDQPIAIGRHLNTTASRWAAAQLWEIWAKCNAEEMGVISKLLRDAVEVDGKPPGGDALTRSVEFFGDLPLADSWKMAHADALNAQKQALAAQQGWMDLRDSTNEAIRREATAKLARQLIDSGQGGFAGDLMSELTEKWSDSACLDGATGRELAEKWRKSTSVSTRDWPRGVVKVVEAPQPGRAAPNSSFALRWERADGALATTVASIGNQGGLVQFSDAAGREFSQLRMDPAGGMTFLLRPGTAYGVARGSLAVMSFGTQIVAGSTLPSGAAEAEVAESPPGEDDPFAESPPLNATVKSGSGALWRVDLGNRFANPYPRPAYYGRVSGLERSSLARPGSFRAPRLAANGQWTGVIGPVVSRGVVMQDRRKLQCVDLLTGSVVWSRDDIPEGRDLFGDEQAVIAADPKGGVAEVYSTIDGRQFGNAEVPPWSEQLATLGRRVLRWTSQEQGRMELSLIDPIDRQTLWKREFAPGSRVDIARNQFIAAVEPTGRATILSARDGMEIAQYDFTASDHLASVHLIAGAEDFILAVNVQADDGDRRRTKPLNALDEAVIVGEIAVFDRSTGRMRWHRGAAIDGEPLMLTQGGDLPLILFVGTVNKSGAVDDRAATSLLALDKATGRTILRRDDLKQAGGASCRPYVADAAKHQAAIELSGRVITLQFTAERRPPAPPAIGAVEKNGEQTKGAIGRIFGLGLGGGEGEDN